VVIWAPNSDPFIPAERNIIMPLQKPEVDAAMTEFILVKPALKSGCVDLNMVVSRKFSRDSLFARVAFCIVLLNESDIEAMRIRFILSYSVISLSSFSTYLCISSGSFGY